MDGLIRPGQPWLDTSGRPIQAHGGSILALEGAFFWYGENKEGTTGTRRSVALGVRCYTSTNLATWEDLGLIIPPDLDDPSSPLHPTQLLDRPPAHHQKSIKRKVCLLATRVIPGRATAAARRSRGPCPVRSVHSRRARRTSARHGRRLPRCRHRPGRRKAYCYFERVHRELVCADLTADYTGFTGYYSTHFPRPGAPFVREAPAHFARNGLHYLISSATTWYFPNPSEIAIAENYHGPWRSLGDPHPSDATRTWFRSQISSVFKHPGKQDLYVALADRWLPELPDNAPHAAGVMATHSASDAARLLEPFGYGVDPDTSRAGYVSLPFRFTGDMPYLDWLSQWRVDDFS